MKSIRLFPTYPAKPAFGENIKVQNAGDYTLNKKLNYKKKYTAYSQSDLLSLKKLQYYNNYTFNKTNLNVNLYTKLDLSGVCVISNDLTGECPTSLILDPSSGIPYYTNYNIDPSGILFGNTTCGINNYEQFMVYNPPYISNTENHINNL
jgi:hypothetical protein